MTARHFAQSPELYGSIQATSPERERVHAAVAASVEELRSALAEAATTGDGSRFRGLFAEATAFLGDFAPQALERSSFLIDRLVERD